MSSLQNIINVNISRQTQVPTRAGFGTGAFISNNATFQGQVKTYANYTEVSEDPQAGADTLAAAAIYFGQEVATTKLTVIKRATANQAQISTLVFSADLVTGNSTVITIDGVALSAVPFDTDNATTLGNIATAIQAHADVATAVDDGDDTIVVTFDDFVDHTISGVVTGGASQPTISSTVTTGAAVIQTFTEALNAAVAVDNDWYGLAMYSRADADITEVSGWVQALTNTNPKLFFAQSDDANILDAAQTSDIAYTTQQLAKFRTSIWYHSTDSEWLDMGVMGGQLPADPGSITWAYKQVSGVTPDDLTDTQKNAASGKAANTYTTVSSVNITEEGKVSDNPFEWIDVIRGTDWITANVATDLFTLLVQLPKLPYDTNGLGMVKSTILKVLQDAQGRSILSIDTAPTVFVPDRADIPAADLANRVLNGVTFTGVLSGAIQKINIQGTVTL